MKQYIKINEKDSVIIALADLAAGTVVEGVTLLEDIASGHKIAAKDIKKSENIIKYGQKIGHAVTDIAQGSWVHTHNTKTNLNDVIDYSYKKNLNEAQMNYPDRDVMVYRRENGKIGVRNELWIVPTVGCVNGIAKLAMKEFQSENDLSGIDGTNVLVHNYGCSQMGKDHENTKIILQNMVKHPNCGGVLVLGLGCENNQLDAFRETLGDYTEERVRFLVSQEVQDEVEAIKNLLGELLENMKKDVRVPGKLSEVAFGLECGGSDGFSGITANPMLGLFSDYTIKHGGTTVLTEVPEMFGAEHLLMQRCGDKEIFDKTVTLVNDFKDFFKSHNQVIYENPSPGNKKGGITTLEEKSLGCTEKSGTTTVKDVLRYGDTLKTNGLHLLESPGNDLVATTALASTGCQIVLFTTGRGNPYGGVVPTVKISTNTPLYENKKRWIDFDAGRLASQDLTLETLMSEFADYMVGVVNGQLTNNEKNDFKELAILKTGVTL